MGALVGAGLAACGARPVESAAPANVMHSAPPTKGPSATLPLPGGWSPVDANAEDVQEAARFAVQAYAVAQRSRTLYKDVLEAQQQVVAGVNFKLTLQVLHLGTPRVAQATVWRRLDGAYQLTDWTWRD